MNSLLQELYNGRIKPGENRNWIVEEHKQKRDHVLAQEEAFCAGLTEAQKRQYIAIIDEYAALLPCEAEEVYIQGMRMGAQLMQELLIKERQK